MAREFPSFRKDDATHHIVAARKINKRSNIWNTKRALTEEQRPFIYFSS
jgi:hypothetical protein